MEENVRLSTGAHTRTGGRRSSCREASTRKRSRLRQISTPPSYTHTPACIFCEGCRAKARHKAHHRGTFNRSNHQDVVTMDQLTVSELNRSTGLGNFKYAIIFHKVDSDVWWFVPWRTLKEAEFHAGRSKDVPRKPWCVVTNTIH